MIGTTLGHYHIVDRLGAGGMGVVYRARDERLERDVAVKVLPAGALCDEETRKRFRREALALSKLNHPNIAVIHDFNTEGDVDFLAMEYISGVTLAEKARIGALPETEVVRVGQQVAEALEAAHEQGMIHRDLKPGNIMMTPKGLIKVLDFGLVKLLIPEGTIERTMTQASAQNVLTGTLPYMAPEQLEGGVIDERTDIHALGAVLYELAAGKRPFPQEVPSGIIHAILSMRPEAIRTAGIPISEGLERIIFKCLEKDPADRYPSAKALIADLNRLESGDLSALAAGKPRRLASRQPWLRPIPILGGSALVLAGLVFGLNIGGARDLFTGGSKSFQVQSLAVLPLENLSRDPEQEYFAEGIADCLITELGQLSTLRVISQTSVNRYKKTDKSLPQIAKELNADMMVEGSVQKSGEKVRISAKLVRPADERQLWSRSYERPIGDVLALQNEIARDVTRQIGIRLHEEANLQSTKRKPVNPQALDAYLKGVYSGEAKYFEQAIKLDPDFAPAYTKLASGYFFSGLFGDIPPREAFSKMKQAALMALEKDDSLGEAHGYLGVAWFHNDLDWAQADKEFKKAFKLNPSLAMLHHLYAHYLMAMGRNEESMSEVKLAEGLDPFAWDRSQCFGWHCLFTKGYDEAIREARQGIEDDPKNSWAHNILGWAYERKGMMKEAIAEFETTLGLWKDNSLPLASLAHAYGKAGRRKDAQLIVDKLLAMSKRGFVPAYDISVAYLGLGDRSKALEWLSKACEERSGFLVYIKCDERFDELRSEPGFKALFDRIGLPAGKAASI